MLPHLPPQSKSLPEMLKEVELLVLELEGTLTDGTVTVDHQGNESFRLHHSDVTGLKTWLESGGHLVVVARQDLSGARAWCQAQGFNFRPHQGKKNVMLAPIIMEHQLESPQVCYLGAHLEDLPALMSAGVSAVPAQAPAWVRDAAHLVLEKPGGAGAVRELVERLLDHKGFLGG